MPALINEVTVLMAAYNAEGSIKGSIKSILNQTHEEFEFIIVNDGSTDRTEEIILSFKDERIKYLKTVNKGTSAALNLGISKAKYKWIARIDADDLNIPERLAKQIDFINNNRQFDIVSSWSVYFNNKGKIIFTMEPGTGHNEIVKALNLHNPLNQSGLMFRKSILKNEKFNEKLKFNEDFELMHRIRERCTFAIIPEYLVYTRLDKGTKTASGRKENIYDFLFSPAYKNMLDSKSKGDRFYWAGIIAWINFFYGDPGESRNYFKSSVSLKNYVAYFATFLPGNTFEKLIEKRIKYRVKAIFRNKSKLKKELKGLLK